MDNREFKVKLLKDKIKKFKEAVRESAERLGVRQPIVRIHECPYQKKDEIAHCHVETGEICISERVLEQRSVDEIVKTATHEVAHLKYADHSPSFYGTQENLRSSTWKPPSGGVVSFSEKDLAKPTGPYKPQKPDKRSCNYWFCPGQKKAGHLIPVKNRF